MSSLSSVTIDEFFESSMSLSASTIVSFPFCISCQNDKAAGLLDNVFDLERGLMSVSPSNDVFNDVVKELLKDEFRTSSPESLGLGLGGTAGGADRRLSW